RDRWNGATDRVCQAGEITGDEDIAHLIQREVRPDEHPASPVAALARPAARRRGAHARGPEGVARADPRRAELAASAAADLDGCAQLDLHAQIAKRARRVGGKSGRE